MECFHCIQWGANLDSIVSEQAHMCKEENSNSMRLWTIHPRYLDAQGLVALWREGLLAQKVIAGETRGYTRHPQLTRFREQAEPLQLIAAYLTGVAREAARRGYRFDERKIRSSPCLTQLKETRGQLLYEWKHLQAKLRGRSPDLYRGMKKLAAPQSHPIFRIVPGEVRAWEKIASETPARRNNHRTHSPENSPALKRWVLNMGGGKSRQGRKTSSIKQVLVKIRVPDAMD